MKLRDRLINYFFNTSEIDRICKLQDGPTFVQSGSVLFDSSVRQKIEEIFTQNFPSVPLTETSIVDGKFLDSLSMMSLCSKLSDTFDIRITYNEMIPENFNSIDLIASLVTKLKNPNISALQSGITGSNNSETQNNISENLIKTDWTEADKPVVCRVLECAQKEPDSVAIIEGNNRYSFKVLSNDIMCFFEVFRKKGITSGQNVVIQAICSENYIAMVLALHLCGATVVPVEKSIGRERVAGIAAETQARLIITDLTLCPVSDGKQESFDSIIAAAPRVSSACCNGGPSPDSNAFILFTTGSTGKSKGVTVSHRAISWLCVAYPAKIGMRVHTSNITTYPLNHISGLYICLYSLFNCCSINIVDGLSNPSLFITQMETNRPDKISIPPMALQSLVRFGKEKLLSCGSGVYHISFGSEPMPLALLNELKEVFPNARMENIYASTELGFISSYECSRSSDEVPLGTAFEGVEIALRDENGNISTERERTGQICIRSKMQMREYFNQPELTASVRQDGWTVLSDMGYLNKDGVLFFRGRADDVIIIGGYKISPVEVEEVAMKSNLIHECICIKDTDGTALSLKLLVVPKDVSVPNSVVDSNSGVVTGWGNFSNSSLMEYLASNLESYRVPRKIEVVSAIARNRNGKIDRSAYKNGKA